jgi:prephenate dehydratase
VAFQGEPGAFSEEAALLLLPKCAPMGFPTLDRVVAAVKNGDVEAACLPIENSIYGSIGRSFELLYEADLRIAASCVLTVRQCLVAANTSTLDEVRIVASHPVALEQCRGLFERHPHLSPLIAHDTAGAVRAMKDGALKADACIASSFAAQRYEAHVILENVQDDLNNYTRFFLAAEPAVVPTLQGSAIRDRATLAFELQNAPGALWEALGAFAKMKLNLTNIVCRPIRSQPWAYRFFVELKARPEQLDAAVLDLKQYGYAKILGAYSTSL